MKKTKFFLSTFVILLLVSVMAFSMTACNNKNGNGQSGNNNEDLGITDSSGKNSLALQGITIGDKQPTEFALGEAFSYEGLTVTADYIDMSVSNSYLVTESVSLDKCDIDSSEYNPYAVGDYDIYVSYTYAGVTCMASYKVAVLAADPAYGGIIVEFAQEVENKYRLNSELKSVTVEKSDVVVYEIDDDGKKSATPLAESAYTAELYLGAEKVEGNTAVKNGKYTLVVTLNSDSTQKDFVPYYIANAITDIELVTSVEETELFTQSAHPINSVANNWQFKLTYESGYTETISGSERVSKDSEGLHIDMDTVTVSENVKVSVTYDLTDALGVKATKSCEVEYSITPNVVPLEFSLSYFAESGESYANGDLIAADATGALGLYTVGTLSTSNGSMTYTDGTSGSVRMQFGSNNNYFRLEVPGMALITMWYWCGTSNADQAGVALYKDSISSTPISSVYNGKISGQVVPATFLVPEAGTYYLRRLDSISANITGITVQSVIPAHDTTIDAYDVTWNDGTSERVQKVIDYASETMTLNTVNDYTPVRTGYTFDGWFTEAEGGTQVTFPKAITEDIVLYAHWTMNEEEA